MNLKDIKERIASGRPVTHQELAWAFKQDQHILFNMLMDNNLPIINVVLRTKQPIGLGNTYLPFQPDKQAINACVDEYIRKKDIGALQKIIDKFKFNPKANNYTTHQNYLTHLMIM